MKWPKGPAGVLLGVGAALLLAVALWAVVSGPGADRGAPDLPGGLTDGSGSATLPAGATGTIPATRTPAGTTATGSASGSGAEKPSPGPSPTSPVPDKTAFTEAQARQTVATFLGHIGEGRATEARAMATAEFAAGVGPEFFNRVSDPISVVEVIMATREGGRWTVYCGEVWNSGPRQTRYALLETGGKLMVDGFELADLP